MRGKKSDPEFVSKFILSCVEQGMETPEEIVAHAKTTIEQLDVEIKKVDEKRVFRSKLLDVVISFEKPSKDKIEDAKLLEFFKLCDPERCLKICEIIKENEAFPITNMSFFGDDTADYNFCIKQLLEANIIVREKDCLHCGERFSEYMKFVLHKGNCD
jgi:hypothetical protein